MTKNATRFIVFFLCLLLPLPAIAADGPGRTARKYLKKGQDAYEKADYKKARSHLEKAVEEFPAYAEAYLKLGQIDLKEKKVKQAVIHFTKATAIDPDQTEAQLALGRIYLAARQPEEARIRAETILKTDPGHQDAILIKASALLAQKQNNDVIALLDPLFGKGDHRPNLTLLLAGAYLRQGAPDKAQEILTTGIADHPETVALQLQLANLYLRGGNLTKAQQTMESVVSLDPNNVNHAIALARLYRESDKSAKADQVLNHSLEQDPHNAARRIAIANLYLETGNVDRARELLLKGITDGDPGAQLRLALGELYIKTGKAQEAVDLLQKGLDTTPAKNTQERNHLRNALATIYLSAGDPATAKAHAEAILQSEPDNSQALLSRGKALLAAGQPQAAIPDFERLLRLRPDSIAGYLHLADAHVRNRQVQRAKSVLDTGLGLAPHNKNLLMAAYWVSLRDKDYKHAEEHLRSIVEAYPQAIDAQAELGDFYLALNDESSAMREYSEIVLKSPQSAIGHLKLARLYTRQGKTDNAIAQLHKGYGLSKQDQALAVKLTTTLTAAERHDEALSLCDARLNSNPKDALAHDLKGKIYTSQKKYKKAQQSFEKACAIDPAWPQASNDLAALFLLQDKKKQAIRQFESALAKNPKNPIACLTLGRLYEEQKKYDKAIAVYEKGVSQIPGFWRGANRLAFLMADRATSVEALDKAQKYASAAYRMRPGQVSIIDTLAWIHYKKGETKQALTLYEKLIAATPNDPLINYHMGVVLEKTGDTKLARERLATATKDDQPFYGREHAEAMLKELKAKS